MPVLNRDGVKLYYEVHGEGRPVLLTHGFAVDSSMWRNQIDAISRHFKLILWDLLGHGRSESPDDLARYSEDETVRDMAAILDSVGAPHAVIGGLSLGGYMSLAFHLRHPDRTEALVIVDTGPGFKSDEGRAVFNIRAEKVAARYERGEASVGNGLSGEQRADVSGLVRAARGMLPQRNARVLESLPTIKVPCLVVVGADDRPFLASSNFMAERIPGAQKSVIPDAGHLPNVDQPQTFNAVVLGFLRNT